MLSQNFPNPFNNVTKISYSLKESAFVKLKVYDLLGREVETLVDEFQKANFYSVIFNGHNLASGIYYYRLKLGDDHVETRKMILAK